MTFIITFLLLLILNGCNDNKLKVELKSDRNKVSFFDTIYPSNIAGNFEEKNFIKIDSLDIIEFLKKYPALKVLQVDLFKFYVPRNYSYAWYDKKGSIEQTYILYNRILQLLDHGIPYNAPFVDEYRKIMEMPKSRAIPENELMIASQYLFYAKSMLVGMPETDSRSMAWFIPRKKVDYLTLLNSLLKGETDEISKAIYPQYYLLLNKLRSYNDIEKSASWDKIKIEKKKYQIGDTAKEIIQIRNNLYLSGDLLINSRESVFDNDLLIGIKRFQERHGLKTDGIIAKQFIKEMNYPISERVKQIIVNMERCKWLPNETEQDHIIVNIPQFTLFAYSKDSLIFNCKVVVGKETNRTMIFKGDMKYVVFSPYWNVPESIIKKEILPSMNRNPYYLSENNMDWNGGKIRQRPGPNNALGVVKFLFPNIFNIYLHDTPSKRLFNEEKRTFSHGCIRVSEPMKLTKFLLRHDTTWTDERITEAMFREQEKIVTLKKSIPVYVVYFTAFVDEEDRLNFRDDIYKRDEVMKEMIFDKKSKNLVYQR